jgi:hypothetical protein
MSATHTRRAPPRASVPEAQPRWGWLTARWLGAVALLAVGAIHLQQYFELYSAVPTIGTLFVLNFIGAMVLGAALLAPIERWGSRWGGALLALVAAGAVALAAITFVMLTISENRPLFGFQEPGYDPAAIARVARRRGGDGGSAWRVPRCALRDQGQHSPVVGGGALAA